MIYICANSDSNILSQIQIFLNEHNLTSIQLITARTLFSANIPEIIGLNYAICVRMNNARNTVVVAIFFSNDFYQFGKRASRAFSMID